MYKNDLHGLGLGIVLGFDDDGDPAIYFQLEKNPRSGGVPYYADNIEVIK
jgi:hypothetical protein